MAETAPLLCILYAHQVLSQQNDSGCWRAVLVLLHTLPLLGTQVHFSAHQARLQLPLTTGEMDLRPLLHSWAHTYYTQKHKTQNLQSNAEMFYYMIWPMTFALFWDYTNFHLTSTFGYKMWSNFSGCGPCTWLGTARTSSCDLNAFLVWAVEPALSVRRISPRLWKQTTGLTVAN